MNNFNKNFKQSVKRDIEKLEQAKKNKSKVLAQTIFLGTVGIIFILPIIVGGYLGIWLDNKLKHYFSISWTISLLIAGVIIGGINVYLFIREYL